MAELTTVLQKAVNDITSYFAFDVVGVYDQNYQQVFKKARPMKVNVAPNDKLMDQPLETGATVTDHRILLPVELELALSLQIINQTDVYQEIKDLYTNGTLLIVQTDASVYNNQVISAMPHEESPDSFDTIKLILKMREVQFAKTQVSFAPRDSTDRTTVNKGQQQPQAVAANKPEPTLLKQWFGS